MAGRAERNGGVAVSTPADRGAVRADLEQVLRTAYPRVVAVAARVLGSRDEAEDDAPSPDNAPGNLRADYVLPRKNLKIVDAAVFWPLRADLLSRLTGVFHPQWLPVGGFPTSDHRLVRVDLAMPASSHTI